MKNSKSENSFKLVRGICRHSFDIIWESNDHKQIALESVKLLKKLESIKDDELGESSRFVFPLIMEYGNTPPNGKLTKKSKMLAGKMIASMIEYDGDSSDYGKWMDYNLNTTDL